MKKEMSFRDRAITQLEAAKAVLKNKKVKGSVDTAAFLCHCSLRFILIHLMLSSGFDIRHTTKKLKPMLGTIPGLDNYLVDRIKTYLDEIEDWQIELLESQEIETSYSDVENALERVGDLIGYAISLNYDEERLPTIKEVRAEQVKKARIKESNSFGDTMNKKVKTDFDYYPSYESKMKAHEKASLPNTSVVEILYERSKACFQKWLEDIDSPSDYRDCFSKVIAIPTSPIQDSVADLYAADVVVYLNTLLTFYKDKVYRANVELVSIDNKTWKEFAIYIKEEIKESLKELSIKGYLFEPMYYVTACLIKRACPAEVIDSLSLNMEKQKSNCNFEAYEKYKGIWDRLILALNQLDLASEGLCDIWDEVSSTL